MKKHSDYFFTGVYNIFISVYICIYIYIYIYIYKLINEIWFSEYVALDDCTDTAIIDDTLQDCNEDATDRYQSHQIDECG